MKYITIHGHFYQPPRENAWLEEIELQDSASPFHDWNDRITEECYGPNGASRILNDEGKIVDITNNYARMSFNFGPTLLSWMELKRPEVHQAIIDADKMSLKLYNGHGSAMAQVYNHIIMPLANRRDKETQVIWGILDFERRFGRKPEGMWLAETAVDLETLDIMAEHGIKFTILAANQAKRYRRVPEGNGSNGHAFMNGADYDPLNLTAEAEANGNGSANGKADGSGKDGSSQEPGEDLETVEDIFSTGRFEGMPPHMQHLRNPAQQPEHFEDSEDTWVHGIDSRRPYLCRLPSGRHIYLYFYDEKRSQEVAFGGILTDGKKFAESLMSSFDHGTESNQLVHIATDGESYGHHHRNGDMALAYCMNYIENSDRARLTNYSEFLTLCEIEYEVEIRENSAWSCAHGVERWRSNCGCHTGGPPEWTQAWRTPLRDCLDWLRDRFANLYEVEMSRFHNDPWQLRNEYVRVPLKRSISRAEAFLRTFVSSDLKAREKTLILALLEIQRMSLLMFTSCGWFFDEISGIEPVQILQYANRGMQLCEVYYGLKLEPEFLAILEKAPSNMPELANGREVYEKYVAPSRLNLKKVGMHYAVRSIFTDDWEKLEVLNYVTKSEQFERYNAGHQRLVIGTTRVKSKITLSEEKFSFVILYLGQHHVIGHTFGKISQKQFREFAEQTKLSFQNSDLSALIIKMREFPGKRSFSFFDMFRDEQVRLLNGILEEQLVMARNSYNKINDRNYHLMNVMRSTNLRVPESLRKNLEVVLYTDLQELFEDSDRRVSIRKLKTRKQELEKWNLKLDQNDYNRLVGNRLHKIAAGLPARNNRTEAVDNIRMVLEHIEPLGIRPPMNGLQNIIFRWLKKITHEDIDSIFNQALIRLARHINLDVDHMLAHIQPVEAK